jgi:heme/copper-type cytochrome/quinol oxidase subunit 2
VLNGHTLDLLQSGEALPKPMLVLADFSFLVDGTAPKSLDGELLWGFRQKKYKRLSSFKFISRVAYDPHTLEACGIVPESGGRPVVQASNILDSKMTSVAEQFNYYKAIKYNKHRSELIPVTLARRLLRTKRTLILPAHVNITMITNSYDVVHS